MDVKTIYLEEYEKTVKCYLGYDEIQKIIMTTLPLSDWNERQKNIDMLLLHYAAGIKIEVLENTDPDEFLQSELINAVKSNVKNYSDIIKGIEYHTSVSKLLYELTSQLPQIIENNPQFKEMISNVNKN